MKLNEIRDNPGARMKKRRVGRGEGSGRGKTCGKGTKGQKARSGVSINGFEGGQNPLYRRLPKRGFSNALFRSPLEAITLKQIQQLLDNNLVKEGGLITIQFLKENKIIHNSSEMIKLIGNHSLTQAITIEVDRASQGAVKAIELAKGKIIIRAA